MSIILVNWQILFNLQIIERSDTGWISEIWKKVQVNIYHIHNASTETNDISEESPDIQLKNDTLKVIVSLKNLLDR